MRTLSMSKNLLVLIKKGVVLAIAIFPMISFFLNSFCIMVYQDCLGNEYYDRVRLKVSLQNCINTMVHCH